MHGTQASSRRKIYPAQKGWQWDFQKKSGGESQTQTGRLPAWRRPKASEGEYPQNPSCGRVCFHSAEGSCDLSGRQPETFPNMAFNSKRRIQPKSRKEKMSDCPEGACLLVGPVRRSGLWGLLREDPVKIHYHVPMPMVSWTFAFFRAPYISFTALKSFKKLLFQEVPPDPPSSRQRRCYRSDDPHASSGVKSLHLHIHGGQDDLALPLLVLGSVLSSGQLDHLDT